MALLGSVLFLGVANSGGADEAAKPATAAATPPAVPRIGFLLPPGEPDRRALEQGAELALARHRGGTSAPAELRIRGKPGQWGDDGDEAGHLVLDDESVVLIAPPGGAATHLALQVSGRTRTPVITLSPDSSVVGAGIPWVLRLAASTENEARALFDAGGSWLVYLPGDRSGREAGQDLGRAAKAAQVSIVPRVWRMGTERPEVPAGIDRVLLWLPAPEAVDVARALRAAGWKGGLAGPSALQAPGFLRGAGSAALGFRVAAIDPGREAAGDLRGFADAYEAKFGQPVEPAALLAADATALALELIRRAGAGPVAALFPTKDEVLGRGLTGAWRFDAAGNRKVVLRVIEWTGRGWRVPGG